MARYRKKPVVIEAEQFEPDPDDPKADLPEGVIYGGTSIPGGHDHIWAIRTREGPMAVRPGDWVITGVKGERYACAPDIFEMTYELVEEGAE